MRAVRFGIAAALEASAALAALVGTRIYHAPGPEGATLPYVTFAQQPGGGVTRTLGGGLAAIRTTMWLVKGVAADKLASEEIDEAAFAALDNAALVVTPYRLLVCELRTPLAYSEREGGQIVHHSGGIYEIGVT